MPVGLPASRLVRVTVNLSPSAQQALNFDTLLIMGSTPVIDTRTRILSFGDIGEVGDYFSASDPEYLAAQLFFDQAPQPTQLYIGRWVKNASEGQLYCGPALAANRLVAAWTPIANGAFKITIDGVGPQAVGNLNFAACGNMNAVAAVIESGLPGGTATCEWDSVNSRFVITSTTTGVNSTISFLQAPAAGTDISGMMAGLATSSGAYTADGVAAETPAEAVAVMDDLPTQWYGVMFADDTIDSDDVLDVAALVESDGVNNPHVYGVTTAEGAAILANDTTSVGALLEAAGYNRSFAQYSSQTLYAVASFFGRAFTVDFLGNNTTITMMYKDEPGVTAELLTTSQADALDANNYNYFATFTNQQAIIVNGTVASGEFFDTIWGVDWLADLVRTNEFNLLHGANKIPQTDAGMGILAGGVDKACQQAIANGLGAPGVWNANGFGQLRSGDFLDTGYYIYFTPVAQQSEADRQARHGTPIQVAFKLAGAVQDVNVVMNVNQ